MPGSRVPSGFGKLARSVTAPVLSSTATSCSLIVPACAYVEPSSSCSDTRRLPACAPPAARRWRSLSSCTLDWARSTFIGSSRRMVASAVSWLAVTSAPGVMLEMPMRPPIGAVIRVRARSTLALARAACAWCTAATAWS